MEEDKSKCLIEGGPVLRALGEHAGEQLTEVVRDVQRDQESAAPHVGQELLVALAYGS